MIEYIEDWIECSFKEYRRRDRYNYAVRRVLKYPTSGIMNIIRFIESAEYEEYSKDPNNYTYCYAETETLTVTCSSKNVKYYEGISGDVRKIDRNKIRNDKIIAKDFQLLFKDKFHQNLKQNTMNEKEFAPHELRVIEEHRELTEKISKLAEFFIKEIYTNLPENDKDLLSAQYNIMVAYSNILEMRIKKF